MKPITLKQAQKTVDFINDFFGRPIEVDADILEIVDPIINSAFKQARREVKSLLAGNITLESVLAYVCNYFDTTPEIILSKQTHDNVFVRHVYLYAAIKLVPQRTYQDAADLLFMDHSSVNHAKNKLTDLVLSKDKKYYPLLKAILSGLAIPIPGQRILEAQVQLPPAIVYINQDKATKLFLDAATSMAG